MRVAIEAILWLLRVQGDYACKEVCIRILNNMYEYW